MKGAKDLICITCPKGCHARVWMEDGNVIIKGEVCKRGKEYLKQEFLEPKRILTSTVVVEQSRSKRLPVRTRTGIPKKEIFRAMEELSKVKVQPPIKIGYVIIPNFLGTGVDLLASDDIRD